MINNKIDLNRLPYFFQVYESSSITSAASALGLTRSAVSQAMKELESGLGEKLFQREGRDISPTEYARRLYGITRPWFEELSAAVGNLRTTKPMLHGTIRIGCPPLFARKWLIPSIVTFKESHPNVDFEIVAGSPEEHIGLLARNRIDLAVVDSYELFKEVKDTYQVSELFREEETLICSKKYFRTFLEKRVDFEYVAAAQFLSYSRHGSDIKSWFQKAYGRTPLEVVVAFSAGTADLILAGVSAHLGLGLLPLHLVGSALKSGELIAIKKPKGEFWNPVCLVCQAEGNRSEAVQLFEQLIKSIDFQK